MNPQTFDPFADMSAVNRSKTSNGLQIEDLARTGFQVAARLQHVATDWNSLSDESHESWTGVARLAAATIDRPDEQADVEVSAKGFARALYRQFVAERYAEAWDDVGSEAKIHWEAIGRHLANLIDSDGQSLNFADLEDRIVEWAKDKTERHQLSLS